jgi:outer membrane protein W
VFNLGVSADLSRHWNLSGSPSYGLLETTADIEIFADNGERLAKSSAAVELNPLVAALLLGYRF